MTPEMLGVLLPMLGFSIVLNVVLVAMLVFRPLTQVMGRFVTTYWLGLQLVIRN